MSDSKTEMTIINVIGAGTRPAIRSPQQALRQQMGNVANGTVDKGKITWGTRQVFGRTLPFQIPEIVPPLIMRDHRAKTIIGITFVLALSQAMIYPGPSKKAINDSDTLDQVLEDNAFKTALIWLAVINGFFSNFALGFKCTQTQLEKVSLKGLDTEETEYLKAQQRTPQEDAAHSRHEKMAFFFAFTSTIAFWALALDDDIVADYPFPLRMLYAAWISLVCLTFVHWQGMAEWVEKYEQFKVWYSRNKNPGDYAEQLARASFEATIGRAQQKLFRSGLDKGNQTGIDLKNLLGNTLLTKEERLQQYLAQIFNLDPSVGKFDAKIAGKVNQRYSIPQTDGALSNLDALFLINARDFKARVRDYFRLHSTGQIAKSFAYYSLYFVPANFLVVASLLGYANTAGVGVNRFIEMLVDCGNGVDDCTNPNRDEPFQFLEQGSAGRAAYWSIYSFIFGLVFSPLAGLCIKSGPGCVNGVADFIMGLSPWCDPKTQIKSVADITMPRAINITAALTFFLCFASGGANAEVNESFMNPTKTTGFMQAVAYILWSSALVSSPVVNIWYGKDVMKEFGVFLGKIFLYGEAEKDFHRTSDTFDELRSQFHDMSSANFRAFVRKLYHDEPETLNRIFALGGMTSDQVALVLDDPQIDEPSPGCCGFFRRKPPSTAAERQPFAVAAVGRPRYDGGAGAERYAGADALGAANDPLRLPYSSSSSSDDGTGVGFGSFRA